MKKAFAILLSLSIQSINASEYKGDTGFLSKQMVEWCSGEAQHQNFCVGFLLGVYENSSCLTSQETPDWEELKKTYLGWVYYKGNRAPVSASVSAMMAFKEKYGCESYLLEYMSKQR